MKQELQTTEPTTGNPMLLASSFSSLSNTAAIVTVGNVTNSCLWEWNQHSSDPTINNVGNVFDCYGTFSIKGNYVINANGRIVQCPSIANTGTTAPTTDGSNTSNSANALDGHAIPSSNNKNNMTATHKQQENSKEIQEEEEEAANEEESQVQPDMILELLPKSTVPHNVTRLIQNIQRTMSQELFDIMDTGYDITYMDDTIRIIRYYTPTKYDGIRNIFRRSVG
jgi:hypothetical protein